MDLNQIYTGDSSHASMRGPFPAASNESRMITIPEGNEERRSTSFIRSSLQQDSQFSSQRAPFFRGETFTNTHIQRRPSLEASRRSRVPLNGGSLNSHSQKKRSTNRPRYAAAAEMIKRRHSERDNRRDSGIAFNASIGHVNATLGDIPTDLAKRLEHTQSDPLYFEKQSQLEIPERQIRNLSIPRGRQLLDVRPQLKFQVPGRQNTNLSINTDRSRSNSRGTGLKNNYILDSLPATNNLNLSKRKSSKERATDTTSLMFKDIEDTDQEMRKEVLEGHLTKIFKINPLPLSESPARDVEIVPRTGRREKVSSARFGDAEAEDEMKEQLKGGYILQRTFGRVRSLWRKSRPRPAV